MKNWPIILTIIPASLCINSIVLADEGIDSSEVISSHLYSMNPYNDDINWQEGLIKKPKEKLSIYADGGGDWPDGNGAYSKEQICLLSICINAFL